MVWAPMGWIDSAMDRLMSGRQAFTRWTHPPIAGACGLYNKAGGFMEENKQGKAQTEATKQNRERIIDLTTAMALPAEKSGKIIDLTRVLYSPPGPPPTHDPAPEPTQQSESRDTEPVAEEKIATATPDDDIDQSHPEPVIDNGSWGDPVRMALTAPADPIEPIQTAAPADADDGEPIIELTDIAQPVELALIMADEGAEDEGAEEESIIDLTDIVSPEELAHITWDNAADDDEAIIELTDIVPPEELAQMVRDNPGYGEPIIELADVVMTRDPGMVSQPSFVPSDSVAQEPALGEGQPGDWIENGLDDGSMSEPSADLPPADTAPEPPMGEDQPGDGLENATDITPVVETAADSIVDDVLPGLDLDQGQSGDWIESGSNGEPVTAPSARDNAATDDDGQDQVIRLDTVLNQMRMHEQRLPGKISLGIEAEVTRQSRSQEDQTDADGPPLEVAQDGVEADRASPAVTGRDLEKAIEEVIRTRYAQTIEQMIATAVEKVVTREMDSIRQSLLNDDETQT
jgi:hypothetical protein